jgi:hypothetical protein
VKPPFVTINSRSVYPLVSRPLLGSLPKEEWIMEKVETNGFELDDDLMDTTDTTDAPSLWEAELVAMSDEIFSALEASEDLGAAVG